MRNLTDPDAWWQHYEPSYADRCWTDARSLLADVVRHAPCGPVVDVGCGYGFLVEAARRIGIEAVGFEASAMALKEGRSRHPQAALCQWSAGQPLPLTTNSVGAAVLNEVVDHFSMTANESLFVELVRVLRPEGVVVVRSPSRFNRFDDDLGHVSFFAPSEFRKFVESFGLQVREQPFTAQPIFGRSRLARLSVSAIGRLIHNERLAARIDLVAEKPAE